MNKKKGSSYNPKTVRISIVRNVKLNENKVGREIKWPGDMEIKISFLKFWSRVWGVQIFLRLMHLILNC